MSYFVTHLEGAIDGAVLPADQSHTLHAGRPILARYDLPTIARAVSRDDISRRPPTLWRYRELLPVPPQAEVVTLGEGCTPLLPAPRLAAYLGLASLWVKDESQLPTGSFKSRGMALAVSMAKHFGFAQLAVPTAGNAGGAMAAYAARAGLQAFVFMPKDTPIVNQVECHVAGAKTFLVNGLINDCGKIVRGCSEQLGWFDLSTLKEPYRLDGKKTMGLELAEQSDWKLPDVIFYPTGGGTGLIGMWKAFAELHELGWLESDALPRMVAVQSDGCAPIVRAFEQGERFAKPWENAATCASGLRVPAAVGDFLMLDAIRASNGWAMTAPESRIVDMMHRAIALEGIAFCPETAACLLAMEQCRRDGRLAGSERVVVFNTGAQQKYMETTPLSLPVIDDPIQVDYHSFMSKA